MALVSYSVPWSQRYVCACLCVYMYIHMVAQMHTLGAHGVRHVLCGIGAVCALIKAFAEFELIITCTMPKYLLYYAEIFTCTMPKSATI